MDINTIKPRLRRRFEYIEFQLLWEGSVGRKILQEQFEISPQQATLDLTAYLDIAPKNMSYDPRRRTYVPRSNFRPLFSSNESSSYLMHLEMLHENYRNKDEIWPEKLPPFELVSRSTRAIDTSVLITVLRAIKEKKSLEIRYVSLSSDAQENRLVIPHAIAGDTHRWHMRAFDVDKKRHSDFVLSRIEYSVIKDVLPGPIPDDEAWNTYVDLVISPDPNLTERQRAQIEVEFSMEAGKLSLSLRKAMLFYYLRFYGFNPREMENDTMRNKSSFNLCVENLGDIEKCLDRR